MADLKGSKTEKNLWEAFAGESQARNKYTFFASKAKKDGYEQIAAIFQETADNEKEHAKLHFKALMGIGTTIENLASAAEGEHEEWTEMYPRMAKDAREEGFEDLARMFEDIGVIEKAHQARYKHLLQAVKDGSFFTKSSKVSWECRNCGHHVEDASAPAVCSVCSHPQAFFEITKTNY